MTVRNCDCKGDCSCDTAKPEIHPRDIVWYGPHPCAYCGKIIAKQGHEFGGREVDYPTDGPIYPNTEWPAHKCDPTYSLKQTVGATYPTDNLKDEVNGWRNDYQRRTGGPSLSDDVKTGPMPDIPDNLTLHEKVNTLWAWHLRDVEFAKIEQAAVRAIQIYEDAKYNFFHNLSMSNAILEIDWHKTEDV